MTATHTLAEFAGLLAAAVCLLIFGVIAAFRR